MKREEWFESKWRYLKRFSIMAGIGLLSIVLFAITKFQFWGVGILLIIPLMFWLVLVPLLHWKDRYIGEKSTLWGALILIETSGWFKIIYWFRHILPDWNKRGRYSEAE